jgi:short-subunit dehydrogenase
MRARFEGQRALITGAASGIGRSTALELARRGYTVGLVDIDGAGLATLAEEVRSAGGEAHTFQADLASPEAIEMLARDVVGALGRVDLLLNNVGVAVVAPLLEISEEDWDWILNINLRAAVRLTRALLPGMIARGSGQVAFTASMAGLIGAPGMLAYSTTKFALVGFAEALRLDVIDQGIDVTVVCPGYVRTNLHRATRYKNDGFSRLLDAPPSWYGVSSERAAYKIVNAIAARRPLLVFGVEKFGWWLKRLWPAAAFAIARYGAKRMGLLTPRAARSTPAA